MPCSYLHFRYVFILRSRLSLPTRASSRQKGRVWCYELEKVLSCRRIFTIQFTHLIICIMAREQEKLSKDVLAVLDKKTNDLRLVSEMNEQTGEFNTVSTAPGDRRRALSFDSRTVLGTFFENLRNQYGRPSDLG